MLYGEVKRRGDSGWGVGGVGVRGGGGGGGGGWWWGGGDEGVGALSCRGGIGVLTYGFSKFRKTKSSVFLVQ